MRILVHDFSGHPFQVQLSRWLARQGHDVLHAHCADFLTPHGALERSADDPEGFETRAVSVGRKIPTGNLIWRAMLEWQYGARLAETMAEFRPDVVLSCNGSPLIHFRARAWAGRNGVPYVFWLQDIYTLAFEHTMAKMLPVVGKIPLAVLRWIEFHVIRRADAVIAISEDLKEIAESEGAANPRTHVIQNWAPADEVTLAPKANDWSLANGLADRFVFMYAGTLAMKHNPRLLSELAVAFADDPDVKIVVISEGAGRRWLEAEKSARGLENLVLLDFVPFDRLSEALGAGDVQLCILEPFAGRLSVPSKILTYIAAERAVLSAIPPENSGARLLVENGIGLNAAPTDLDGFIRNARALRNAPERLAELRGGARAYKSKHFDIEIIGKRFLEVLGG